MTLDWAEDAFVPSGGAEENALFCLRAAQYWGLVNPDNRKGLFVLLDHA